MVRSLLLAAIACLTIGTVSHGESSGAAALERIKSMAGTWNGTTEWTGARTGTGSMTASYYLTGNGSAVVEDLGDSSTPVMTSVYHLDGDDLRMTHYCGAQNQPRLKAARIDMSRGFIEFAFVDITNLKTPESPHVHGAELQFVDADHVVLTFVFHSDGGVSREKISLARAARKS